MDVTIDRDDMLRRFLSYVRVWTTSQEGVEVTPTSERQWDLARVLAKELAEMGLENVRLDDHCYVYGLLPERFAAGSPRAGKAPAVGLIAHMDVSPQVSGENVQPIVHERYDGGEICLPGDTSVVLRPDVDAPLGECRGLDIVTSDGTTLLGADNKAGVAIIMAVIKAFRDHPALEHGPVCVAFTPDEEVGRGVAEFDLEAFGAEVAYTVDGEGLGEVEDETFCADSMDLVFHGISVHPGFAKGKMINSLKLAADLVASLPRGGCAPETTAGREGYVHPRAIEGNEEKTVIKFILRDFTMAGLRELGTLVEEKARAVIASHPGARLEIESRHWYKNMKVMLDQRPEATAFAEEAIRKSGLDALRKPIRGGTDGARLSYMGIPTPNIFTGGHNFHSKREWIPVQHMVKSAEVCLRLMMLWGQRGQKMGRLPSAPRGGIGEGAHGDAYSAAAPPSARRQ